MSPPKREVGDAPLVVDPRWLLRTVAAVALAALLCGYGTLCLLFYQGQWQLVLHPVQTATRPATIAGTTYDFIRFGPDSSGVPQRTGWWMGVSSARLAPVVLFLPSGDGSLLDAVPKIEAIRGLGVTLFAVNYRGYGESAAVHPSEERMTEDAEAAWSYVTNERHVRAEDIVFYGAGVGASLAMGLAARHPTIKAVVLDNPRFDVIATIKADPRVRLLPVDLLLRNAFLLRTDPAALPMPKLILTANPAQSREAESLPDPKSTVEMLSFHPETFSITVRPFLDGAAVPLPPSRPVLRVEPPQQK